MEIDMRFPHFPLGSAVCSLSLAFGLVAAPPVEAAAPGITAATLSGSTSTFNLSAAPSYTTQPDGMSIYSWGYGCTANSAASFAPAGINANAAGAKCPTMQVPGPTLIVNQGDTVTVTLTNNLPAAAGNTSILFPGFNVTASGGANGLLTKEAQVGGTVTYTFVANSVGTHAYYSGTQGDVQVEMGLYGAIIVLPTLSGGLPTGYSAWHLAQGANQPDTCTALNKKPARASNPAQPETDYRLAAAAYDNPGACYDREYLFQLSEVDPAIHQQVEAQKDQACTSSTGCMVVKTQPYHPVYYVVNGRSMPDDMDPNYVSTYPHQPYNGNPHMHPGELTLLRIIGQGHLQHPLHEHANHVRLLARDGNLLLTQSGDSKLAGPLLFTTTTTPGQAMDGIFQFTAKGLNWDVYGHGVKNGQRVDSANCYPDANGYYTTASSTPAATTADNYYEWCGDHLKPLESKPFGQVGEGGPVTLPDANIVVNGTWYGGSPYLGPDATTRAVGPTPIPPAGTVGNDPGSEAGYAYMWHSHNEREITTNNIFPGGMMMMMLVDPWVYPINEAN
jgi:FtsP/CotA-like multicopper oxidase with cupredoxin domain